MIDVDSLLQSFGDDAPSGEDMEYDADFMTLEVTNQPGEERVIGDSVIPAEEPDFAEVARQANELLGRTKDLRVAVILANAALRQEGLPGFEEVLRYIRGCLEDFWDSVHPQLDPDDDDDPTMRVNAVLGLKDGDIVLRSLRMAPLTASRAFGRFSLRDIEVAEGEITPPPDMDTVPDQPTISAAFQDSDDEELEKIKDAATKIQDHTNAILALFDDKIGAMGPNLDPLKKMIYDINRRLASYAGGEAPEELQMEEAGDAPAAAVASGARPAGGGGGGAINGPNDVINAIDRIVDYYNRNEPSSPVPLLLKRARRLVSADFFTIMKDMAPGGVDNVVLIGGMDEDID
ncbi:MAG: type VI secretion system protein TssA [Pseudomonadota bacterium]